MPPRTGRAVQFVLGLPTADAAEREILRQKEEERLRAAEQAKEKRRLNREADEFEQRHGLPGVTGVSTAQINFGRRCRLAYLRDLSDGQRAAAKELLVTFRAAGFWIGASRSGGTLADLMAEAREAAKLLCTRCGSSPSSVETPDGPVLTGLTGSVFLPSTGASEVYLCGDCASDLLPRSLSGQGRREGTEDEL